MVRVEIVVQSGEDAAAAERGGAHRLELCCALPEGGLTPSPGLVRAVRARTSLPIMAMVRVRPGGFVYAASDFEAMEADVETVLTAGADGIVTGVLTESRRIDLARCRALVARAGGRPVVFHRAFDATADPFEALEALVDLGFARVLTGGHQRRAIDGIDQLRALVERAAGRIEILPGGSVRADNAAEIVARTGADQIHLAPVEFVEDPTWPGGYGVIREAAVAEVVAAVREATEPVPGPSSADPRTPSSG